MIFQTCPVATVVTTGRTLVIIQIYTICVVHTYTTKRQKTSTLLQHKGNTGDSRYKSCQWLDFRAVIEPLDTMELDIPTYGCMVIVSQHVSCSDSA